MIINHNMMAQNANRMANINQSNASKAMAKLSSGLRINSAADDASGLAISEKMKGQINGLNTASSNAQTAVSLTQTADGALSETTSVLQRMRELAVQSSSDTNTTADRTAIQTETTALTAQIDNIATTTQFNTKNILDGSITAGTTLQGTELSSVATTIGATATGAAVTKDSFSFSSDMTLAIKVGATSKNITIAKGNYNETQLASAIQTAAIAGGAFSDTTVSFASNKLTVSSALIGTTGAATKLTIIAGTTAGGTANDTTLNDFINGKGASPVDVVATVDGVGAGVAAYADNGQNALEVKTGADTLAITTGAGATGTVNVADGIYNGTQLAAAINTGISANASLKGNAAATYNTTTNTLTIASTDNSSITLKDDGAAKLSRTTGYTTASDLTATDTTTALLTNLEDSSKNSFGLNVGDVITVAGDINGSNVTPTTLTVTQATNMKDLAQSVATALNLATSSVTIDAAKGTINVVGQDGTAHALSGVTLSATDSTTAKTPRTLFNSAFSNMAQTQAAQDKTTDASLTMQIGANQGQTMKISVSSMTSAALGVNALDLTTKTGAQNAITAIDTATAAVSNTRSQLGAYQNRLQSTINNLGTTSQNLTSAQSAITDVDMAATMAEFSKDNVESQAAQAMIAQANQQPQQVLQLLR